MNKIAVVLSGPPGCGKDTIANIFVDTGFFVKRQFKDVLYEHTAKHFKVDLDKFIHYASERSLKDSKSLAGLGGRTPRQALIHVSEDIYKPREGSDYFGRVEASSVEEYFRRVDSTSYVIYPDGGFPDELGAIDNSYDCIFVVRLHRDGFSFEGDSRNYIHLPDTEKRSSFDIHLIEDNPLLGAIQIKEEVADISYNKHQGK